MSVPDAQKLIFACTAFGIENTIVAATSDGHHDKYRNRIHCMEDNYSDISGLQYASKQQKSKFFIIFLRIYVSVSPDSWEDNFRSHGCIHFIPPIR